MSNGWRRHYTVYDPERQLFRGDSFPPPESLAGQNQHGYALITSVAEIRHHGHWPDGASGTPEVCAAAYRLDLPPLSER